MREYGRVSPTFWTRGSGKKLRGRPRAQLIALYLFTCPASTMLGIYHLALPTMAHELGMTLDEVERGMTEVCEVGIAKYDPEEELVFLPEGARYQIGERLKPGDRRVKGIAAALAQFGRHPFALEFTRRYAAEFCIQSPPSEGGSEGLRMPLHEEPEGASKVLQGTINRGMEARQGKAKQGTDQAHASRAGVRARVRDDEVLIQDHVEDEDPEPTGDTTDAKVLRALRAAPAVVRYEHEGTLRLTDCATELTGEVATFVMGGKVRDDEALDRVLCAIRDANDKTAAAATTSNPLPAAKVAHLLKTFTRANLSKTREVWAQERRRSERASGERGGQPIVPGAPPHKTFVFREDPDAVPMPASMRGALAAFGTGGRT